MGKTTLILAITFVLIIGGILTLTNRRQGETLESVTELYHAQQARQEANSLAQEGITVLRQNINDERPDLTVGAPQGVTISHVVDDDDEFFVILATATVDGVTYETEAIYGYTSGTPSSFQPGSLEQFFILRNDRIDFIDPHPNFNSANFNHSHNHLTYSQLSEYSNVFFHNRPMRFAVATNVVIQGSFIIYSTADIYLHGTIRVAPGAELIIVSETAIVGGKKVDNNFTNPDSGAVIPTGSNVKLYAPTLRSEANNNIRIGAANGPALTTVSHPNIFSMNLPGHYSEMENPGGETEGTAEQLGTLRSWHSRQISTN
jgi:hypothetical protein